MCERKERGKELKWKEDWLWKKKVQCERKKGEKGIKGKEELFTSMVTAKGTEWNGKIIKTDVQFERGKDENKK